MIHDNMPYDPNQGQDHGGLKVVKMVDFKCYLLHRYACKQKINQFRHRLIVLIETNALLISHAATTYIEPF